MITFGKYVAGFPFGKDSSNLRLQESNVMGGRIVPIYDGTIHVDRSIVSLSFNLAAPSYLLTLLFSPLYRLVFYVLFLPQRQVHYSQSVHY